MQLPDAFSRSLVALFAELPLDRAMGALCPTAGCGPRLQALVEDIIKTSPFTANRALQAGLWLYVDELDRSHEISQDLKDPTGSYWHGIMHRREGDFSNSHYWFHRTGKHPAMALLPDYDGHALVDAAEAAYPRNPDAVVRRQREEWANLFAWCASNL